MDVQEFGKFISRCRKEKNMTQMQLADLIHVSDKAISRWERGLGFPEITILAPLAEALGISLTELMQSEKKDDAILHAFEIAEKQIEKAKKKCLLTLVLEVILEVFGIIIACYYVDELRVRMVFVFMLGLTGISISLLLRTLIVKR